MRNYKVIYQIVILVDVNVIKKKLHEQFGIQITLRLIVIKLEIVG